MPHTNHPYHYNYQILETMLTEENGPEEIGRLLDDVLFILVLYLDDEEVYPIVQVSDVYHIIRRLRDVFYELPNQ